MLSRVGPQDLPKKLIRSTTSKFDEIIRSPETARKVSDLEDRWVQHRHDSRMEEGTLRGVRLVVHRGWVAQGSAHVHVRVVESAKLPDEGSRIPYWNVLNANLRRHAVLPFPGVTVRAHLGAAAGEAVTDRHGYASISIELDRPLHPGWHEVSALTLSEEEGVEQFSDTGRVLQPATDARFAVVSDIDDTVIRTGLDEGMTALRRTLFRDAHTRRAVPGMASLYRGLQRGVANTRGKYPPEPAFFYLSTGTWSFYEMLTQFLQLRGYPRGPLFLTDWGPSERYLRRSGVAHKKAALARLRAGYPDTPLVLIGDSGQNDPDTYLEFARANLDAVRWILIMQAGDSSAARTAELREQAPGLRAEGIPFTVAGTALEAAEVAHEMQLCDGITLEEVETEMGAIF
jgi:phosphatidate phosphatase APP1